MRIIDLISHLEEDLKCYSKMTLMMNGGYTVIYYGILQAQPPKKVRDNF